MRILVAILLGQVIAQIVPVELTNTRVSCGTKQVTIEPALLNLTDPIKYYKVGDCIFEDLIEINSQDERWLFDCGFTEMNSTNGILTSEIINELWTETGLNETEWSMKYVTFKGQIEYHSRKPPSPDAFIWTARDFATTVYTQDFYCHYERLWHMEIEFIGPSCLECQGCLIGGQVMLDEKGICPPEYQHFLDFDEYGEPIWVNNCTCEVILEPIGGDGNFDVTKGLYLDEHLETPYDPATFNEAEDSLFIGFELIDVTNPTMFVIIERLWVTEEPDPLAPKKTMLLESVNNGECLKMHHDMGDPPSPNPAEEGEHPHLAFGLNFEIFYELGYRNNSVCVTSGENCFPQRCEGALGRFLDIDFSKMQGDFTGGGFAQREQNVMDDEWMSTAYYAPNDPESEKKRFWKQIIDINREKVDKLMTVTNGTIRSGKERHHKLYKNNPLEPKTGGFHRGKRSVQNFRFHEILTAGPYKMGELRKVDTKELVWNPAALRDISDQSFGSFLTTPLGHASVTIIVMADIILTYTFWKQIRQ